MLNRSLLLSFPVAVVLALILVATPAFAADITVTTTDDELTTNGACSLREAIRNANANAAVHADCPAGAGADLIGLPAGVFRLTIAGREEDLGLTGDLDIRGDLEIVGSGSGQTILDGNGLDRVLDAHTPSIVGIWALTVRNGDPGSGFLGDGGGIYYGYDDDRRGSLTLTAVVIRDNRSDVGGGMRSAVPTTVRASVISGNRTIDSGGGGIYAFGDVLTVVDTVVSDNESASDGGGIVAETLVITSSTIAGNRAGDDGGGVAVSSLTMLNTTVVGNTAEDLGGGVYVTDAATIRSSTITGNVGSGLYGGFGSDRRTRVSGTIIARNINRVTVPPIEDCRTPVITEGYNLEGRTSCGFTGPGDIQNADPRLGSLADNGGPTPTLALLSASPAIDAGSPSTCPATDQRGAPRPADGDRNGISRCDIGAFELGATPPPFQPPVRQPPLSARLDGQVSQKPNDDDTPRKLTEEQKQQRQRTNRSGLDDERTEGNVTEVGEDGQGKYIVLANRDGLVTVRIRCANDCPRVQVGDYAQVEGIKEHEGLYYADAVSVGQ